MGYVEATITTTVSVRRPDAASAAKEVPIMSLLHSLSRG